MLKINDKFKPLFEQPKGVRYYVLTGGRGSSKSFTVSVMSLLKTYTDAKILYTRYTLTSASKSIVPEFTEKIELLNKQNDFKINNDNIVNNKTGSSVIFSGIKTSSGNQTANLKSLNGISVWVLDEAEELVDENTFNKINLSIRDKTKQNIVVLILNPTTVDHWIYKRFKFDSREIGFNGIVDDTCFIHTDYLDNIQNLDDTFLKEVERLKQEEPDRYNHEILGGWLLNLEGALFLKNDFEYFKLSEYNQENKTYNFAYIDSATGGGDSTAYVYGELNGGKVYITDVLMIKEDTTYSLPACIELTNRKNVRWLIIETNGAGAIFMQQIIGKVKNTEIRKNRVSTNKETRIIQNAHFIKKHFVFRNDYEAGSDYDRFMKEVLSFNKDKKLNKHDDAPDALAGLSNFIQKNSNIFKL